MAAKRTSPRPSAVRRDVGTVGQAIQQSQPFPTDGQEALLTLLMTAEKVHWPFQELFAQHDLTAQQYNVLRILRGAGKGGLPTLDIVDRMVERTPGITRLIDRLVKKGLVERVRSEEDRRQVWCHITRAGLQLLRRLDRPVAALDAHALDPLNRDEIRQLLDLRDRGRTATSSKS